MIMKLFLKYNAENENTLIQRSGYNMSELWREFYQELENEVFNYIR